MNKSKVINYVHLLLLVLSTGFIASIKLMYYGVNLIILASFLVIVSERFLHVTIRYKYFTLVPFLLLGVMFLLFKLEIF